AINEYFPKFNIDTIIDMRIYNRWGELLYQNESTQIGWDGKFKGEKVQEGVYMYLIKYRNCYGRIKYLRGTFTLLR
ncbi:MAG: T9SS type B sorting domain-containing protein, partial [Candidatus Paceibacterota bacterium]